jgi:hypothetical protein
MRTFLLIALLLCCFRPARAQSTVGDGSLNAESIPPSGFTCTAQLGVNYSRAIIEAQNRSTDAIKIILDDGAGNNATILSLAGAPSAGQAGQSWSDPYFKGRLRVCVPSANAGTDIVAVRQE